MGIGTEDEGSSAADGSPKQDSLLTSSMDSGSPITDSSKKRLRSESDDYDSDVSSEPASELSTKVPDPLPSDPLLIDNFDEHLPPTVSLLQNPRGAKVYLVGTAHFSVESQDDVSLVIRNVRPHIVMVELCQSRASILQMDEETIEREAKNITFEKVMATIKENGVFQGLMYTLFLNLSAQLTKELGMAPGGEFRRALAEVRMIENCVIHFGDRPIHVTLKRALTVLSWWNSIRLIWCLTFSSKYPTKEEVEQCKQKDLLEQMLKEMSGKFPELGRVFVEERDKYLTYSLQLASCHQPRRLRPGAVAEPTRVVGIVGMGHVAGITKLWGTVKESDIPPIMKIPPPSRSGQVVKATLKVAVAGLVVWGAYKLFAPKAVSEAIGKVPQAIVKVPEAIRKVPEAIVKVPEVIGKAPRKINSLLKQVEVYEASLAKQILV